MVPDKGGLLFLARTFSVLFLLLSMLAGTTATLLAAFVALSLEPIFDGAYPVQDQLVDLLDNVKDAQLILDVSPVPLQTVFVGGGAIGNGHLHNQFPIPDGL